MRNVLFAYQGEFFMSSTGLQIKWRKKSAHLPSCVKFCTLTLKICEYYCLPLRCSTVTAVHMVAPVPEIVDTGIMTFLRSGVIKKS
jgi:hypothetical protein